MSAEELLTQEVQNNLDKIANPRVVTILRNEKGEVLATVPDNEEAIATASLNLSSLQEFRLKFPAWKDADEFVISSNNSSQ